ncbi:MAG: hypothetical protein ACKOU7_02945 [Ferruginibacter sp.]
MTYAKFYLPFICAFLFASPVKSQVLTPQDSSQAAPVDKVLKKKTTFTIGTVYLPTLHFYGRTDSLKSTALAPNVLLQFGNGIYISSTLIFTDNKMQPFSYGATIAGAGFRFGKEKGFAGTISGDLFFYDNKGLVQSSQKGQVGFTISYLNKYININSSANSIFADDGNDYFTTLGLSHKFKKIKGNNILVIIPAFTVNTGTQNFTNSYYKTRSLFGLPVPPQQVTESNKKFKVLSFEASIPLVYVYKKLALSVTPGFVIPQNVLTVPNRPDLSENAKNLFYGNLGIFYTFKKSDKKKKPATS